MRKTLFSLVTLALFAGSAIAAPVSVSPDAYRSYGDQGGSGAIWSVGSVDPLGDPACGALTTVLGAAYVGTIGVFDIVGDGLYAEDDMIRYMGANIWVDASTLVPGGDLGAVMDTDYSLQLTDMNNFGISYKLAVTSVPDTQGRAVLAALGAPRGPFGAGFSRPQNLMTAGRPDHTNGILGESEVVPFAPAITTQTVALSPRDASGAGSADSSASTNAFGALILAAHGNDPINTCDVSCAGGNPNETCDTIINNPLGLAINADDGQTARWQQWMSRQGFLFGFVDNILVLGNDPVEPSTIAITFDDGI